MARESYQWSEDFQQKLLALYLREPKKAFRIMEPGFFSDPISREIARLAKNLLKDQTDVQLSKSTMYTVVKESLGKKRRDLWRPYRKVIKSLYQEDLSDKDIVLGQALTFAKEQRFRNTLIETEKDINAHQFDKAIKRFEDLKGFGREREVGLDYWQDMTPARWMEDREGIVGTFFLKRLDQMMGGGLAAGELGVILAGGKVGKSMLLGKFAAGALWRKKNVAIATGELSAKKYRKRIDTMITGVPSWKLSHYAEMADQGSKHAKRKLRRIFRRLGFARSQFRGNLFIRQWPTNKGTTRDIEDWLEELKEKGIEIDILYVDYLRTFRPVERYEDMKEKLGSMAMELRGLAGQRNIPIWTAAQTTRASLNKPNLGPEDVAEDISIFWTLDFLVALSQTAEEKGTEDDRKKGKPEKARLYLTAARDVGSGGVLDVEIIRNTLTVREIDHMKRKGK